MTLHLMTALVVALTLWCIPAASGVDSGVVTVETAESNTDSAEDMKLILGDSALPLALHQSEDTIIGGTITPAPHVDPAIKEESISMSTSPPSFQPHVKLESSVPPAYHQDWTSPGAVHALFNGLAPLYPSSPAAAPEDASIISADSSRVQQEQGNITTGGATPTSPPAAIVATKKRVNCSCSRSTDKTGEGAMARNNGESIDANTITPDESLTTSITIVNNTELASSFRSAANDSCTILVLYAPWCPFSARLAPHLNTASRAFPDLNFLAVNGATLNNLNSKFATVAVPNVVLFQGQGKFVARFNYSEKYFQSLVWFIQNATNLTALPDVDVTTMDYSGPLPSQPTQEPDYHLVASWVVLAVTAVYYCGLARFIANVGRRLHAYGIRTTHVHVE